MIAEDLREKFECCTKSHWLNSQGEPDLDYVMWLEDICIRNRNAWSEIPALFAPVAKIEDPDIGEHFEADTDIPPVNKSEIIKRHKLEWGICS